MSRILVIAGTDSSGGAGLTRDTATANALGHSVMPVVTSVTAQRDTSFGRTLPVPPDIVSAQITSALATAPPAAIKIGMLGNADIAEAVGHALQRYPAPLVIDPVLRSTSGGSLYRGPFPWDLYSRATLLTPNLEEAAALLGRPPATNQADINQQAIDLGQRAKGAAILIKGGHSMGRDSIDTLQSNNGLHHLAAARLDHSRRGTGCTLATAIACHLAQGASLTDACAAAKSHVTYWLALPA